MKIKSYYLIIVDKNVIDLSCLHRKRALTYNVYFSREKRFLAEHNIYANGGVAGYPVIYDLLLLLCIIKKLLIFVLFLTKRDHYKIC